MTLRWLERSLAVKGNAPPLSCLDFQLVGCPCVLKEDNLAVANQTGGIYLLPCMRMA